MLWCDIGFLAFRCSRLRPRVDVPWGGGWFIQRRDHTEAYCRGGDSDGKMTLQNEQEAEIRAAILLRLVSKGETMFLGDFYEKDK